MVKKIKYGKMLLVIFLTGLIWFWADQAKTEDFSVSSAAINMAKSTNPNLWVSFEDDESSVSIKNVVLRGSASRIADVSREINDGSLVLEFFLDPQQEAMTESGRRTFNTLNFLRKSDQIRQLGLTVESCEPKMLSVNVVKLEKKTLRVRCVDESQNPVKTTTIEPAQVAMFVPGDWEGEKLAAVVSLTRREKEQARVSAIEKTPYIELSPGQTREAPTAVKITVPPEEDWLGDYTITKTTPGFLLSANLQGKYTVELTNPEAVMSAITIRATADAKRAYEKMPYQVILEINDADGRSTEPIRRELVYNFPPEYQRKDEIKLNQQPVVAQFRLKRLFSGEAQPTQSP